MELKAKATAQQEGADYGSTETCNSGTGYPIYFDLKGDVYLPELELPEERSIGRWGRLHKEYLKNHRPILYQSLILSGKLYTVLADLNEQAAERCSHIIRQMAEAEGITEELKANDPMRWVQAMNSIRCRAEEIIRAEMIYC